MSNARLNDVITQCRRRGASDTAGTLDDRQLLARFAAEGDGAAFEAILARHGPMVMGVCRRVLGDRAAAEDAFQATFLVLVKKAGSVRGGECLGSWLYGVAFRTASRARVEAAKRRAREAGATVREGPDPLAEMTARELLAVLDEELSRLSCRYRAPLVACYLEGRTRDQAAGELGCSLATLDRLLARARELLGARLARRGLLPSAALLPLLLSQATASAGVPPTLVAGLVGAVAAGGATPAVSAKTVTVSAQVAALAEGVSRAMFLNKLKTAAVLVLLLGVAGAGAGFWRGAAGAVPPDPSPRPSAGAVRRPAPPGNPKPAVKDEEAIQGFWQAVGLEVGGEKAPQEAAKAFRIRFKGDKLLFNPDSESREVVFALDPGAKPKAMDLTPSGGPDPGKRAAIYRLDGDTLTICLAREGGAGKRPTDFKTAAGDGLVLLTLERVKEGNGPAGKGDAAPRVLKSDIVFDMAWSGDGKVVAGVSHKQEAEEREVGDQKVKVTLFHSTVRFWDAEKGGLRVSTGEEKKVRVGSVALSPDGKTAALIAGHEWEGRTYPFEVRLVDTAKGTTKKTIELDGMLKFVAFSPDGKTLAVGGQYVPEKALEGPFERTVRLYDLESGKVTKEFKQELDAGRVTETGTADGLRALAYSRDGKLLASADADWKVRVLEVGTGKTLQTLDGHTSVVWAVAFSPDGKTLVTGSHDGSARVWDVGQGKETRKLAGHKGAVKSVAFSPDGRLVATGGILEKWGAPETVLWDAATWEAKKVLPGERAGTAVMFSPDGKSLAVGGNHIALWRVEDLHAGGK